VVAGDTVVQHVVEQELRPTDVLAADLELAKAFGVVERARQGR